KPAEIFLPGLQERFFDAPEIRRNHRHGRNLQALVIFPLKIEPYVPPCEQRRIERVSFVVSFSRHGHPQQSLPRRPIFSTTRLRILNVMSQRKTCTDPVPPSLWLAQTPPPCP